MPKIDTKRHITNSQYQQSLIALEELNWLLESSRGKTLLTLLPKLIEILRIYSSDNVVTSNISNDFNLITNNSRILVGILPEFFTNTQLFPTNADIEQFAREILGIKIVNYDKKSRTEIIGVIVCSIDKFKDSAFSILGKCLSNIIDDEKKCNQIINAKKSTNFSWNDTINKIYNYE